MTEHPKVWTILAVLNWTKQHFESKGIKSSRLDAEVILAHALKLERVMLYARFDQPLGPEELALIRALVARRGRGEPVAYLAGEREFWSLAFQVSPSVLIPRPETETLIEVALEAIRKVDAPVIADVGCGSGCIGITLAHERPTAKVYALDVSEEALETTARNRNRHAMSERIEILQSDLLSGVPETAPRLDLICANLPYIPTAQIDDLMRDVRDFEPRSALDGGEDGLAHIRRLIVEAGRYLAPGGHIVVEAGHDQVEPILELLKKAGFEDAKGYQDGAYLWRVADALWPG